MSEDQVIHLVSGLVGGGILTTISAAALVYALVRKQLISIRKEQLKVAFEAAVVKEKEAEADETPNKEYRSIIKLLRRRQLELELRVDELFKKNEELSAAHQSCEKRAASYEGKIAAHEEKMRQLEIEGQARSQLLKSLQQRVDNELKSKDS